MGPYRQYGWRQRARGVWQRSGCGPVCHGGSGRLGQANSTLPESRHINFRIGVHVGDVMVRAGDLFGDGVNIAARLQTLARAGGLCVSGVTYDQVRKILPLSSLTSVRRWSRISKSRYAPMRLAARRGGIFSVAERLRLSVMVNPSRCPTNPPSLCSHFRTCPVIQSRSILQMGWSRTSPRRFRGSNRCSLSHEIQASLTKESRRHQAGRAEARCAICARGDCSQGVGESSHYGAVN